MHYIDDPRKLADALQFLEQADRIAVDTEADSLHRFSESLCLVQVSARGEDYVLDPITHKLDLAPLAKLLENKNLIFHGADFDIRILKRFYGFKPIRIFDTMVAAQLLGYPSQSLQGLVERHYGVKLAKANQKADWSRRPLTASMLDYAAGDTHYLEGLADTMERELAEAGRLDWFAESCEVVIESSQVTREIDTENRWRVKGSGDLSGRELVLLRALWQWREKEAERRDRPSFKVFNNDGLLGIARWKAANPAKPLAEMPEPPGQLAGNIAGVERAVDEAMHISPTTLPAVKKAGGPRRMDDDEKEIVQRLKEARNKLASELKCDPGVLAPNAALEAIVINKPKSAEDIKNLKCLKNWQTTVTAQIFLKALSGEAAPETTA